MFIQTHTLLHDIEIQKLRRAVDDNKVKTSVLVDKIDRLVKEQMTKRDPKAEKKHQADEISRRDKDIRKLQADLRDERDKANKNVTRLNEEISVQ